MSSILVTGASGLIGRHLVGQLAEKHDVWTVGRNEGRVLLDLAGNWDEAQLPRQIDSVVHLAQAAGYRNFPESAERIVAVSVTSTARLLGWARRAGARSFVLASTGGVYAPGPKPATEESPLSLEGELSFYFRTRRASELLAEPFGAFFGVTVLRYFFVYGRGQSAEMLFPRLVRSVREGKAIDLAGNDGLRIQPTHVSDAARATEAALGPGKDAGFRVVNVAGPEVLSLRAVAEQIGSAEGRAPQFRIDTSAVAEDRIADVSRMTRELAAPLVRFAEGVRDLL